jgi:hypothetical protein
LGKTGDRYCSLDSIVDFSTTIRFVMNKPLKQLRDDLLRQVQGSQAYPSARTEPANGRLSTVPAYGTPNSISSLSIDGHATGLLGLSSPILPGVFALPLGRGENCLLFLRVKPCKEFSDIPQPGGRRCRGILVCRFLQSAIKIFITLRAILRTLPWALFNGLWHGERSYSYDALIGPRVQQNSIHPATVYTKLALFQLIF